MSQAATISEHCDLCGTVGNQSVVYGPFTMEYEYHSKVPTRDIEFRLAQCSVCGVVKTKPSLTDDELEPYYSQDYTAHSKLQLELVGKLSFLERLRNAMTVPFLDVFFGRQSATSAFWKALLTSPLFPRMFRGFPLEFAQPQTLLDVGCGDGAFLYQLSALRNCRCTGIDLSPVAVDTAKSAGLDARQLNIENPKLDLDGPYDVIRMSDLLEHTLYPGKVLSRAFELLSPGGELIIHVPNYDALSRRAFGIYSTSWHLPFHRYHFTRQCLTEVLTKWGFTIRHVFTRNTLHFLYSLDYRFNCPKKRFCLISLFTRLLFTPLDVLLDILFRKAGDGLEVHAIKQAKRRQDCSEKPAFVTRKE